jgi:two-component system, NtrC family, sensor kinase
MVALAPPRLPSKEDVPGAEAIPHAEAVLRTLLDSVGCGILLFGSGGALWGMNEHFSELLRMEPRPLRKLANFDSMVAHVAPQFADSTAVAARWRDTFQKGEPSWDEMELLRPERKVLERFARPVSDGHNKRLGWLEIYRDITGHRMIESRLFHTDRLAALGQLVSGVAHELNNPLTSILGYAQLLLRREGSWPGNADAKRILEEAERASRISKNLLLFARENKPEKTEVNLNEIVERTLALRAYELRLENIRAEADLDPHLPRTFADGAQIQQALLNLIINAEQAIHASSHEGRIWVRTRRVSPARINLEVADDGPGIPPEIVLRIFDPFFTTKPPGVGTGLGLSILCGIVHQHGGEVTVGNRPGGGVLFSIELPIVTKTGGAEERPRLMASPGLHGEPANPQEQHRERILVVEDEPTVARLIADVLGEEGHPVDTVLDSRKGLDLIGRHAYALIICDLRMPHLDGRGLYRELIRRRSPLEHRLVFVTGDTLSPRTVDFLEKSGVPYLAKPFLVEELKAVVHRALRAASGHAQAASGYAQW